MKKKIYNKPEMDVVVLKARQQMLAGSLKTNDAVSEKPSYSRRYNGFEDEDEDDWDEE